MQATSRSTLLTALSLVSGLFFSNHSLAQEGDVWLELNALASDSILTRQRYSGGIFYSTEQSYSGLNYYFRGGLSTLVAFDNNPNNDYYGFEGSAGLKLGGAISFLAGVGVMMGRTDTCEFTLDSNQINYSYYDNSYTSNTLTEECSERSVAGLLPEIGIRITLGNSLFISAFTRKYILSNGEQDFYGRGISVGFGY